jgi:diguanylate cyclase (GGDEF)-like protein
MEPTEPPDGPTSWSPYAVMGLVAGLLAAWLWGDRSAVWLASGALIGGTAGSVAALAANGESRPASRAVSFFLTFQAGIALIPFLAIGGVLAMRSVALTTFHPSQLVLIPVTAAAVSAIGEVLRSRRGPERRREPRSRDDRDPRYRLWLWIIGMLPILLVIAALDRFMPAPYSLDFLYLGPTLLVAWRARSRGAGFFIALLAAESRGIVRGYAHHGELLGPLVIADGLVLATGLFIAVYLLHKIQTMVDEATRASRTDELTGLSNRKAFLERVDLEVARAADGPQPFSIAYLDLDGFKAVNDTEGHSTGDEVLKIVSNVLKTAIRADDVAARLGGDEFAILLPRTDPDVAPRVVERVRAEIEQRMEDFSYKVTCSVGMVTSTLPDPSTEHLLRQADALMYEVKHAGKNAMRQMILEA